MMKVQSEDLLDLSRILNDSPIWFRWNAQIFPGRVFGLTMIRKRAMRVSWTQGEIEGEGVACLRLKGLLDLTRLDHGTICVDRGHPFSIMTSVNREAWFRMSNWDEDCPSGETHQFWRGFDMEFLGRHPEKSQGLPVQCSRGLMDSESLGTLRGFMEDRLDDLDEKVLINLKSQEVIFRDLSIKIRVKACQDKHGSCSILAHDLLSLISGDEFRADLFYFSILSHGDQPGTFALSFPNLTLIMPLHS